LKVWILNLDFIESTNLDENQRLSETLNPFKGLWTSLTSIQPRERCVSSTERKMAAPMAELPVEPQSLRKLSLKSLKRGLDLFVPSHGASFPLDAERFRFNFQPSFLKYLSFIMTTVLTYIFFSFAFFVCFFGSKKIRVSYKVIQMLIFSSCIFFYKLS
jgi:hypothetical protein